MLAVRSLTVLEKRHLSLSAVRWAAKKNLYAVLGLTPKATQSDIKKAYYKLSMQHHPDKNKGSSDAVQKFREITEAYEVLGSYKTRKRYDQGMVQKTFTNDYSAPSSVEPNDDPQTKFYKQHMKKDRPPPSSGSTPIYDFDEWARAHYGTNFARRQTARKRYERIKREEGDGSSRVRTIEYSVLALLTLISCLVVFSRWDHDSYDTVRRDRGSGTE